MFTDAKTGISLQFLLNFLQNLLRDLLIHKLIYADMKTFTFCKIHRKCLRKSEWNLVYKFHVLQKNTRTLQSKKLRHITEI